MTEEQAQLIWNVYVMYRYRSYNQKQIAEQLNISVALVGRITRRFGFHRTTTKNEGKLLYILLDKFSDCFK